MPELRPLLERREQLAETLRLADLKIMAAFGYGPPITMSDLCHLSTPDLMSDGLNRSVYRVGNPNRFCTLFHPQRISKSIVRDHSMLKFEFKKQSRFLIQEAIEGKHVAILYGGKRNRKVAGILGPGTPHGKLTLVLRGTVRG